MSVTVCVVCMMHTYVYGDGVMVCVVWSVHVFEVYE